MATPFGQIPLRTCTEHKGRPLELYCDNCDTLLCLKCQSSTHKGHVICKLGEKTPQINQDIQHFIDKTEQNDLVKLQENILSTDTLLGSNIERYDTECEINSQISLPVKSARSTSSFIPNQNPLYHLELALGEVTMLDQVTTAMDGLVRTSGGQKPAYTSQQPEPKEKKEVTISKHLSQTIMLEKWKSPVLISSLCPTNDGQVWICDRSRYVLTLLNSKGKVTDDIKYKTNIIDISLSPTTHTLWVCDGKNNIMELVSGQLTYRFSTKEKPRCICVTASNNVIVGMTNNISKFTTEGQIVLTTSATGTWKRLVCSPWRISECPLSHNVAVVDRNSKGGGGDGIPHVIVMDTDFKELFVYRGDIPSTYLQSSNKGDKPFNPWCVVYGSVGNIIIGDYNNKRVLLISGRGEFLRIIHKDKNCTQAVGVDREDILWVKFGGKHVKLLQHCSV